MAIFCCTIIVPDLKLIDQYAEVEEIIQRRFELVGGRIRDLTSDIKPLDQLQQEVEHAFRCLAIKELHDVSDIDITGMAPSLCYSIIPVVEAERNIENETTETPTDSTGK